MSGEPILNIKGDGGDEALSIGPYSFLPSLRQLVSPDGRATIQLTRKEALLLSYLHKQQGHSIDRRTLLSEVWGYNGRAATHTLETHVYRLRRKMERDPSNAELLVSADGGYRLVPQCAYPC